MTPFCRMRKGFHCMLWQICLAHVCGREGGKDFPTALHAMLRHDGKLCCFSKLLDDVSCATHAVCKGNNRILRNCSRVNRSRQPISKNLA